MPTRAFVKVYRRVRHHIKTELHCQGGRIQLHQPDADGGRLERDKINLEIDGQPAPGKRLAVMDAATKIGIFKAHFCLQKLSIAANAACAWGASGRRCRSGMRDPATEGMNPGRPASPSRAEGRDEFLLINHPLDCPICDQGGGAAADLAVGYGASNSRYQEKRVVVNKNLGPSSPPT